MKLPSTLASFLWLFCHLAVADCNTVMGGCIKEESVNVAPHMRSETLKPAEKPATVKQHKETATIVTSSHKVKANTKKL